MPALVKTIKIEGDKATVTVECPGSGKTKKHNWQIPDLSVVGLKKWYQGAFALEAFPNLSVNHREGLISGCCPNCWKELVGS